MNRLIGWVMTLGGIWIAAFGLSLPYCLEWVSFGLIATGAVITMAGWWRLVK